MKILCPYHKDTNPSLELYEDGFYCFVCGAGGSHRKLERKGVNIQSHQLKKKRPKPEEEFKQEIEYITGLPKEKIRGLDLHADKFFYYVLWPGNKYYIRRKKIQSATDKDKYLCPSGMRRPLYVPELTTSPRLFIIEGELNALSAAHTLPTSAAAICSPGGASDFENVKNINFYKQFKEFHVCVDNDRAGAVAIMNIKPILQRISPSVYYHLTDRDFNDILQQDGKKGVAAQLTYFIKHPEMRN